ncbi:hypothetical protein NKDENANG_03813 [Candidatus Entotheonellaceae bacterium PAL068K]
MTVRETVTASKKLKRDAALALAREADRLIAAKGKKVTTVDLAKDQPSDEALARLMLGPSGNLRAPTIRVGRVLLVGYNDKVFTEQLG